MCFAENLLDKFSPKILLTLYIIGYQLIITIYKCIIDKFKIVYFCILHL